jgi:hypothetical protein
MKTIDRKNNLWVHYFMKKASVLPIVIIVATFLIIPVFFWIINFGNSKGNIQGIETGSSGLSIKIISKDGAWDLSKYLCKDKNECIESLTSGKSLDKTSGGGVYDQEVGIKYSSDWDQYQYIKVFVEPGWGSADRNFMVSVNESIQGIFTHSFEIGSITYNVAVIPLSEIQKSVSNAVTFSDR